MEFILGLKKIRVGSKQDFAKTFSTVVQIFIIDQLIEKANEYTRILVDVLKY